MRDYSTVSVEECAAQEVIRAFISQIVRDPALASKRLFALFRSLSPSASFMDIAARIGCLGEEIKTSVDCD